MCRNKKTVIRHRSHTENASRQMSHLCDYARDGVGSALMMALRVPGWKSLEAFLWSRQEFGVSVRVLHSVASLLLPFFVAKFKCSGAVLFFDKCNKHVISYTVSLL